MQVYNYITSPIGTNTYLVTDETKSAFIVDPGEFSQDLADKAAEDGLEVKYIILTHGHGDHIGGVAKFQELYPEAKVVASEKEKDFLNDPKLNNSPYILGRAVTVQPDILVKDGDTMWIGNMHLEFRSTPGHTPGGMCIVTGGAVFSGDTLFRASVGRTDFPYGSTADLINSIKTKLLTLPDDTIVYTGHMDVTTIGFERRVNPVVGAIRW
ncbi:MAG: MBL fold metallo-hydrolase [Eubacteriales bacterium]|nr:MBL fold metallo-hydrolase [Eubacteriales bacterium]